MKSQMTEDKPISVSTVTKQHSYFPIILFCIKEKIGQFLLLSQVIFTFQSFLKQIIKHFSINVIYFSSYEREFESHKGITQQYECGIVECYHVLIYIHIYSTSLINYCFSSLNNVINREPHAR